MSLTKSERASELGVEISTRLRVTREALGLAKRTVEVEGELSRGLMTRLESSERGSLLSAPVAIALARVLRVDVGWLLTGIVPDGSWAPHVGTASVTKRVRKPKAKRKKEKK